MVALGLSQRVNLAWGATILLLVVGAAFTATQVERLWISAVLVVVVMLVAPLRRCFYRHARLLSGPLNASSAVSLFALVICLLALVGTRPRVHLLANNAWWAVVMSREVPHSLRLTVALAVTLALIAIWRLLRPGKVRWLPWDARRGSAWRCSAARFRRRALTAWCWARRSVPASRSAAAAACCWASAIRWAPKAIGSRRSGGCATWRSRRAWIRRSGAPARAC